MNEVVIKYKKLQSQLVNSGCEESPDEVMWNDCIMESMDDLLKDVHKDVANLLKLNLI